MKLLDLKWNLLILFWVLIMNPVCYSNNLVGQELIRIIESSASKSLLPAYSEDDSIPVFWNDHAKMYKFAPAFETSNSSWINQKPAYYAFDIFSFADHQHHRFMAKTPSSSLEPVWDSVPAGGVYLKIEAVDSTGSRHVLIAEKLFHKAAAFCPPYPPANKSYAEALTKGLDFMFEQPHIQAWLSDGRPNHQLHPIYCYSALEVGSVINAMVLYHRQFPDDSISLRIAQLAANYLIDHSEKKGAALEGFPQVYEGDHLAAARFQNQIILTEPAATGQSFLLLFDETADSTYFEAALRIARTYRKTQHSNGTWYVRLDKTTGKPVTDVFCIPMKIVQFLQLLSEKYQQTEFNPIIEKAVSWTFNNPVKTWDWTGQFEDVDAAKPYENLTKYEASWFAQYLLNHPDEQGYHRSLAVRLIDFCEDQFVVWEQPGIYDNWNNSSQSWHVPAVLEQYHCYVPIDASAVQMIDTYQLAWIKTGEPIYLEKALTLANSVVNVQEDCGRIPTFWAAGFEEFWNNCMVSSLWMLNRMKDYMPAQKKENQP